MNKKLLCFYCLLLLGQLGLAQSTKIIKGIVLDSYERPVAGVLVESVKNKTNAVTDSEGVFQIITAQENDSIRIHAMGYFDQVMAVSMMKDNILRVHLAIRSQQMEEVIVNTGYQKLPKERSTGSFEKIDPMLFSRPVTTDLMSRLEGITSGLFVSKSKGTSEYFIRGLSTINANTAPLIILDDFPYEGDINNINPNDIDNIVVLKDAAAASIWGARSGNGVIVVTTKKGRFEQKPSLSFNANLTIQQKPDLFYSKSFLQAPQFIDLEKDLFSRGFYDNDLVDTYNWPVISPVVELLNQVREGTLSEQEANAKMEDWKRYDIRNDYQKYFYQKAINQQYALNLSGGSKQLNYLFSFGYDKDQMAIKENQAQRFTARQSISFKPLSWLTMQSDVFYTCTNGKANGMAQITPSLQKSVLYPYARLVDDNGLALTVDKDYRGSYIDTVGEGKLLDWKYNPINEINAADNTYNNQDIIGKLNVTAKILTGVELSVNGLVERADNDGKNYYSTKTYLTRDLINKFSTIDGDEVNRVIPLGGIVDNSFGKLSAYSLRGQFNYNRTWKGMHALTAIAGAEIRQVHTTAQTTRTYGYDDETLAYSNVDYVNLYPLYGNFGYGFVPDNTSFGEVTNRFTAFYANAAYTYKNTYTLTASARKDAANIFGVNANQKGVPLWSTGVAYKISNASFYKIGWLPLLKIRATYGYNGNMRTDLSSVPVIYRDGSTNRFTHLPYATITTLSNKDLRWEQVAMVNAGIDFATKNDGLMGSIEYYHKNAKDLLSASPIDPTLGINTMTYNVANLTGQGVDIKLTAKIINKRVQWNATALYSYVTNKLTKYLLNYANKGAYVGTGVSIKPIEGQDPYAIVSYRFIGLDHNTGNPIGIVNGKESTDYYSITNTTDWNDLHVVGSARAPHFGNLINTITWQGLSLSCNISFKAGFYVKKSTISYSALMDSWVGHEDYNKRWMQPGDELKTTVPSLTYADDYYRDKFYLYSDANVIRGDVLRIQDIQFSYELPHIKKKMLFVKNAQLYTYWNNVGILWKANKSGIDPDYGESLPNPRSFSIGLKANF